MTAFSKALFYICLLEMPCLVVAEEAAPKFTVEDNIRAMDKDGDGLVTVYEVRALIEAKHGL
jgi:Ca2+-binding EF-hand superfamily protein